MKNKKKEKSKTLKVKNDNIIKRWYKLVEPNKTVWLFQIITYIIYAVFLAILTVFAARTINCLYHDDWNGAFINLALELFTIVTRNIVLHLQYKCYAKHYGIIRTNVANKIYNKLLHCKKESFKTVNNEKIVNIAINNMSYLAEFPDAIAGFLAYIFQVAISLVMVFSSNYLAGIIVTLLGVVNFFAYFLFNKKLGKIMNKRFEKKDEMMKTYNKVLSGKEVINELKVDKKYNDEVIEKVKDYNKLFSKYYNTSSRKTNLWYIVWNVVVYAITALLIFYVSKDKLDIAVYLIIVPYLTSCTEKLNSLFDKTTALENMRVDVDRVNTILAMSEKELVKFGDLNKDVEGYNLGLIDVSFEYKNGEDGGKIKNADISFKMDVLNIIKGEKGSGKRVIFDLLRRHVVADNGVVLLDNINLNSYQEKTFKNQINYCSSHPYFLDASIEENLTVVEKDINKVKEICDKVGATSYINKLSKGFSTPISEVTSKGVLFLLGLVRALLSKSKILMIYELPEDVSDSFRKKILKFLTKHEINQTVILFTHSDIFDELAGMHFLISNGKVKEVGLIK